MTELAPRMPCPVCLGTMMEKLRVGKGGAVELDLCRRCGGVWFEQGEVQQLRRVPQDEIWSRIGSRRSSGPALCHDCHSPLDREAERCPGCGASNILDCPDCARPMKAETFNSLRLDVCRSCKGVWFDHHEIEAIWTAALDQSVQSRKLARKGSKLAETTADGVGDIMMASLFYTPDLLFFGAYAAGNMASAGVEAASRIPGALGSAPEAAAGAFEAVGEVSGSLFEAIVEIVGGIFDAF